MFLGDIYVYRDGAITAGVPNDAATIHAVASEATQKSEKCSTTISKDNYWLLTEGLFSVNNKTDAQVVFRVMMRPKGGVFVNVSYVSVSSTVGTFQNQFRPFAVVPQNADIRIDALASGPDVEVGCSLRGLLMKVQVDN